MREISELLTYEQRAAIHSPQSLLFCAPSIANELLLERPGATTEQGGRSLRKPSRAGWPSYHATNPSCIQQSRDHPESDGFTFGVRDATLQDSYRSKVSGGEVERSDNFHLHIGWTYRNRNHFEAAFLRQRTPTQPPKNGRITHGHYDDNKVAVGLEWHDQILRK